MNRMKDIVLSLACATLIVLALSGLDKDNTDPPDGRSGLRIYRDNLTGCEYLGTFWGGLSPRFAASGEQICNRDGK